MEQGLITAVGVDVSKGKSTVAVRRPGGQIVMPPIQVNHTAEELAGLVERLRSNRPLGGSSLGPAVGKALLLISGHKSSPFQSCASAYQFTHCFLKRKSLMRINIHIGRPLPIIHPAMPAKNQEHLHH